MLRKHGNARQATDNNMIWRMRLACWIPKATNTHSEYIILIVFPQQQWLHERASMLPCYTLPVLLLVRRRVYYTVGAVFLNKSTSLLAFKWSVWGPQIISYSIHTSFAKVTAFPPPPYPLQPPSPQKCGL